MSKFKLIDRVRSVCLETSVRQQTYLRRVHNGDAASIFGLCLTSEEVKARLGAFNHYCPVRYVYVSWLHQSLSQLS
jgi:riboflavin synthase alpha subunit